jgi:hypothetical protein
MTLQEFIGLDKQQQQQAWREKGVKLAERVQPDFRYELYQVDDFYVEVKIQIPGEDGFVGLQTFETTEQLEPYFQLMKTKTSGTDE